MSNSRGACWGDLHSLTTVQAAGWGNLQMLRKTRMSLTSKVLVNKTWILQEGKVFHVYQNSSILAWKTPWTEELGPPRSMGSQRVWHNWVTNTVTHYHTQRIKGRFMSPVKLSTCLLNIGKLIELCWSFSHLSDVTFFFLKYLQCCLWIFSGNILCPHLWQSLHTLRDYFYWII